MANMLKTKKYSNFTNILLNPNKADVFEGQVTHSGYLKAGAVVGGATNFLQTRNTKLTVVKDETAQGILLNDLRDGETNAAIVVAGTIDSSKIESFETNVPEIVRTTLKNIIFVNGGYKA